MGYFGISAIKTVVPRLEQHFVLGAVSTVPKLSKDKPCNLVPL